MYMLSLMPCSARQALRHPYFRELREAEKRQKALMTPDLSNHFNAMAGESGDGKGSRHQTMSPNGSDAENNTSSPPETSRASEAGLPLIGKQGSTQLAPAGSGAHAHPQHHQHQHHPQVSAIFCAC